MRGNGPKKARGHSDRAKKQGGQSRPAWCKGNVVLRQRDLLAVEERLELDRGARVAELLDEGEKLVELLRVAHGEAEQRVELTHHVIVADDGALRGAEIAEFVILVRLERNRDKARDVTVELRAVDVDVIAADHAAFLHPANAFRHGGRRQPYKVSHAAQRATAVVLEEVEDLVVSPIHHVLPLPFSHTISPRLMTVFARLLPTR